VIGFLISWLVNSTIVAVVAGFQSGEMTAGQWIVAGAGGLVLGYVEVKLIGYFFGERKPILDPMTGQLIGTYRERPGRLGPARDGKDMPDQFYDDLATWMRDSGAVAGANREMARQFWRSAQRDPSISADRMRDLALHVVQVAEARKAADSASF
jgi:hypothetical protein